MSSISIKQLLEAGVHFGHQTRSWNPKMNEYIFGERSGIHIIDLQKTLRLFKEAVDFVVELTESGSEILFVGTKRQAQEAIEEEAQRCGMHYVTNRWLGGLLTNFQTVQNSIRRYKELEQMKETGFYERLGKKEVAQLERERKKLDKNLRGIRNMNRLPDAVFVVDSETEEIAVREAVRLGIPIIAVVDTNCDPDPIDYVIPGNDDALRSVKLFTSTISDAVLAGRAVWDVKLAERKADEERRAKEEAEKAAAAKRAAEEAARRTTEALERKARAAEKKAAKEAEKKRKAEAEAAAEKAKEKEEAVETQAEVADTAEEKVEAPAEKVPASEEQRAAQKEAESPAAETADAAGDAGAEKPAAKAKVAKTTTKTKAKKPAQKKAAKKAEAAEEETSPEEAAEKEAEAKATEKKAEEDKKKPASKSKARKASTKTAARAKTSKTKQSDAADQAEEKTAKSPEEQDTVEAKEA